MWLIECISDKERLHDVYHIDAAQARSKSWKEFAGIEFDFVITEFSHLADR
jgi:hypothetical protein